MSKILANMKKKDRLTYERIGKRIDELCQNPRMAKPMTSNLKGSWRVHVGSFVLLYRINESEKKLEFYDLEHHDKAY
ncbi:ParE toxin of type II toxin-antitoxin system, parDE [uncultured archaeon]|nr:ParE toxin of type II toxin-antitoxin system, parDE [uncultured archaeon]